MTHWSETPPNRDLSLPRAAFDAPYIGAATEDLAVFIEQQEADATPPKAERSIRIVQSSGTGKSRAVRELGKQFPTLVVCCDATPSWPRVSEQPPSWPPPDEGVLTFLNPHWVPEITNTVSGTTGSLDDVNRFADFCGEERAAALLGALLGAVRDTLSLQVQPSDPSPTALMRAWEVGPERDVLIKGVIARAQLLLNKTKTDLTVKQRFGRLDITKTGRSTDANRSPEESNCQDIVKHLLAKELDELAATLHGLGHCRFILALDRCTDLNYYPFELASMHRIVKAANSYYAQSDPDRSLDLWLLLISTNYNFDHNLHGDVPSRVYYEGFENIPLWNNLGFDHRVPSMEEPKSGLDTLALARLAAYGRPDWGTLEPGTLLNTAVYKLLNGLAEPVVQITSDLAFVLLAQRLSFGSLPGGVISGRTIRSVRAHMSMLSGSSSENKFGAETPSEPLLAVAAAHVLTRSGNMERHRAAIREFTSPEFDKGNIGQGFFSGELCCRFLFTLARDKAAIVQAKQDPPREDEGFQGNAKSFRSFFVQRAPDRVRPVKLQTFLEVLIGNEFLNSASTSFLRSRWINFTHFKQSSNDSVTREDLYEAWCRGWGLRCTACAGRPACGLFVTYSGALEEEFDKSKLGYVVWYVNTSPSRISQVEAQWAEPSLVCGTSAQKGHVALFMDLGTDDSDVTIAEHTQVRRSTSTVVNDGSALHVEGDSSWWYLRVCGRGKRSYPVLAIFGENVDEFEELYQYSLM